jgi:drug/metabolite transporter (DMT)-like permease
MFSYIDPVVALILSSLLLKEEFTLVHLIGSILILGAAFISELPSKK